MQPLAIAVVAVPFLGAIACSRRKGPCGEVPGGGGLARHRRRARWHSRGNCPVSTHLFGAMPWLGAAGSNGFFGYQIDALALIMLLASTVIGVAIVIYSAGYLSPGNKDHPVHGGPGALLLLADALRRLDGRDRPVTDAAPAADLLGDDDALFVGADLVLRQRGEPESRHQGAGGHRRSADCSSSAGWSGSSAPPVRWDSARSG